MAEAFYKQVAALMAEGWDGLQYSVEGCGPNQKPLIPGYEKAVAGVKAALGSKELGVWIHNYCNTPTDFCMTCSDFFSTANDRVIYYGPQFWGYMSDAQIELIAAAQLVLGKPGTPGMGPKAISGNLFGPAFGRPSNLTLLRSGRSEPWHSRRGRWPEGRVTSCLPPSLLRTARCLVRILNRLHGPRGKRTA